MNSMKVSAGHPIFLLGLPRSGSTLWANIIGGLPDIAQFSGVHFLSVWHRDFRYILKHEVGDLTKEKNVSKLIEIIFSKDSSLAGKQNYWFWKQIRDLDGKGLRESFRKRVIASEDLKIGTIFRILIEEATHCSGHSRALVKFPVYPAYIGELINWWPDGRFVHISRDPRALATSKTNDPGGVSGLVKRYNWAKPFIPFAYKYFSVFQYIWASQMHARFKGYPNYRLFLYEDLVTNPESVIRELCEFCSLDYDESMLYPAEGQASSITGKKARGFDPSRMNGWQKVLSPRESSFIKHITKSSMKRFGYDPKN